MVFHKTDHVDFEKNPDTGVVINKNQTELARIREQRARNKETKALKELVASLITRIGILEEKIDGSKTCNCQCNC